MRKVYLVTLDLEGYTKTFTKKPLSHFELIHQAFFRQLPFIFLPNFPENRQSSADLTSLGPSVTEQLHRYLSKTLENPLIHETNFV